MVFLNERFLGQQPKHPRFLAVKTRVFKTIAISIFALLYCVLAHSQERKILRKESSDTLTIYFPLNQYTFDPSYMGNKANMDKFIELSDVQTIVCRVTSSPEGPLRRNAFLSKKRAESVAEYINAHYEVTDEQLEISTADEAWEELEIMIRESDQPWKNDLLNIFMNTPILVTDEEGRVVEKRKSELQKHDNGKTWEWLKINWFPQLRQSLVIIRTRYDKEVVLIAEVDDPIRNYMIAAPPAPELEFTPRAAARPWERQLHLKSNVLGWALGHINIAAEIDLAPHWSLAIPFYYSGGFDYFTPTLKFRGIVLQPEARYYFRGNDGFYAGAHAGLGWYNFALNREFRIQDHKGRTPAYGGGLGLGYALHFKKNPRWGMEFALGAGVYSAKYDLFYNEPNGPCAEYGVQDVFVGIDNASVSFTYTFNLKKEGRK